jgi:hypothetical protein
MNKIEIKDSIIQVFTNGAPAPFISGVDYFEIAPGIITPYWVYPAGLSSINDAALGRNDHPFVHVTGGYEEKPRGHAAVIFPPGCRVFYFNQELLSIMNYMYGPRLFFHNKLINTLPHIVFDRYFLPNTETTERPDLFEINGPTPHPPFYKGNLVLAASEAGHNFVCQTYHGIFDKICHELWRLSHSGIDTCYFIALYTHKQNLTATEVCPYRNANASADINYAAELQTYCNDITHIDPNYIHLLFKGVRPVGYNTYFHVFIIEKLSGLNLIQVDTANGPRIRPEGYGF